MGKTSNAVKDKWNTAIYDDIRIRDPKGQKHAEAAPARLKGETINGLVNGLLRADMGLSAEEWKGKSDAPTE